MAGESSTPPTGSFGRRAEWRRALLALVLFAVAATPGLYSVLTHRQLGTLGGFIIPWARLVLNYAVHGTVGVGREPTVYKAPGFPVAAGLVMRLGGKVPAQMPSERPADGSTPVRGAISRDAELARSLARPVYLAQCLALALAAAGLFVWLSHSLRWGVAFAAGLTLATNPYSVVLCGVLHYGALHLALLALTPAVLDWGIAAGRRPQLRLGLAGAFCGVAALVRTTTMLLAPFVLVILILRERATWRRAVVRWLVFLAGLLVVLAPYAVRNARLTGRLLVVNAQGWEALFGSTVRPISIEPNRFRWKQLRNEALVLQSSVAGEDLSRGWEPYGVARNLAMQEAYRRAVLANLRRQPGVYVGNVLRSSLTLLRDINGILVQLFEEMQRPGARWPRFGSQDAAQDPPPSLSRRLVERLFDLLGVLALLGLAHGIWRRDPSLIVPGLVALGVGLAQVLTWMDFMYYYVKVPFVVIFAFYALDRLGRRWATPLALTLASLSLLLTLRLF